MSRGLSKAASAELALTFVRKSDTMPDILRRLFKRLDVLNLNVKKLWDKGFYSMGVIRLLRARGTPFILPAIARKKDGVSQLFVGRASYKTSYMTLLLANLILAPIYWVLQLHNRQIAQSPDCTIAR